VDADYGSELPFSDRSRVFAIATSEIGLPHIFFGGLATQSALDDHNADLRNLVAIIRLHILYKFGELPTLVFSKSKSAKIGTCQNVLDRSPNFQDW